MALSDDRIVRMWEADNLIAILAKMDTDRLPPHEGRAVGECQAKAVEEWLEAYAELRLPKPGDLGEAPPSPTGL